MISIFYNNEHNVICIDGIKTPFPSGSLRAARLDNLIAVQSPCDDNLICAWTDFSLWRDGSGNAFSSAEATFAYVNGVCNRTPTKVFAPSGVCGEAIGRGMPVAFHRATGRLVRARADSYPLSFIVGLAQDDAPLDAVLYLTRASLTLADWSGVTGLANLEQGALYFLARSGGLTRTPDLTPGGSCVKTGQALSPSTLTYLDPEPILL